MGWDREEWLCQDQRARVVKVPLDGESDSVLVSDVLDRKVWFPDAGIFVLRKDGQAMYVGRTTLPIRLRLLSAIYSGKTWAAAGASEYRNWSLTMQRVPEYPHDQLRERGLIGALKPVYNIYGRPPKPREKEATCQCRGECPTCGLRRVPAGRPRRDENFVPQ